MSIQINKYLRTNILLGLLFLLSVSFSAQDVRFQRLTIKDGLSQSAVNCITQDSLGYIWIGTQDGLNRYDGVHFKVFKHLLNDPNSLTSSYVNDIEIDRSGMIWIGTQSGGVNIYDPVNNSFATPENLNDLSTETIEDLFILENKVYISTERLGLYIYEIASGRVEVLNSKNGFPTNSLGAISYVNDALWIGTKNKGMIVLDVKSMQYQVYSKSTNLAGLSNDNISVAHYLNDTCILIGTADKLQSVKMNSIKPRFSTPVTFLSNVKHQVEGVSEILDFGENKFWIGTTNSGLYFAQIKNDQIHLKSYRSSNYNNYALVGDRINSIFRDNTGTVWIGTQDGISYFDPVKQGFQTYTFEPDNNNSISDKTVWAMYKEQEYVYVGSRLGLTVLDRNYLKYYQIPFQSTNALQPSNHSVYFITKLNNKIYAGTSSGLQSLELNEEITSSKWTHIQSMDDEALRDNQIYRLSTQDSVIWTAGKEGISRVNVETGSYTYFDKLNGYDLPPVRVIHLAKDNIIWIGTIGEGIYKAKYQKGQLSLIKNYRANPNNLDALSNNTVLGIIENPENTLWIATYGGGMNKLNIPNEHFTVYTEEDGLTNNSINAIGQGTDSNTIWMSTNYGLSVFDIEKQTFTNYHESDGLQSNEFNSGAFHSSRDGELFFGGINGFNTFYPEEIKTNRIPPNVVITDLLIGNKNISDLREDFGDIAYKNKIELSYQENNLTFKFAALHYTYSEGNLLKVQLEGVDQEPFILEGYERNYANLSPGEYTLYIWASNSDGYESEPKVLKIFIASPFWMSWWFITACVVLLGLIIYATYIWRIKSMQAQKERLAFLVEKRTKTITHQKEQIEKQKLELEIEKEKAERLLHNVLPAETAEELKNKGKTRPRYYRMVTVIFTDIKGFTKIAEDYKPTELVKRLDNLFREIDKIIERHQLEKIKTIGDAYMAAGGVPLRDKENPINSVLAALEIQAFMNKEKQRTKFGEPWEMRIGLHTGDIIAGVIGTKRIAYDIWGNTVNVAQRMEMAGEPGKVNISGTTYEYIKPYFDCTYRGKIAAKNKGDIDMYFIEGIKPHLSKGGKGKVPNAKFKEYVNLHIYSSINYRKAERHIMKILRAKLSPNLHYHGIHHTYDVVEAVERLAIMEGVLDEDIFVLKSAATYHDAGFVEEYDKNEPIGARMASEILPLYGYTEDQVDLVHGLIYATIIPHDPKTHLQEIICDADLDYLGRDDFFEISDTLRRELRDHGKINSDRLWDEIQVKFLTQHKYFTKSAKKLRSGKKALHLEAIKKRLEEDNYKD